MPDGNLVMSLTDVIMAVLFTAAGISGLFCRSLLTSFVIFAGGGLGVAALLSLLSSGSSELGQPIGGGFLVFWVLLFALAQAFLRTTPTGKELFSRSRSLLERIEGILGWMSGVIPVEDEDDYRPLGGTEQRQFDYSIKVAAKVLKEKELRNKKLAELYGEPDPPQEP